MWTMVISRRLQFGGTGQALREIEQLEQGEWGVSFAAFFFFLVKEIDWAKNLGFQCYSR